MFNRYSPWALACASLFATHYFGVGSCEAALAQSSPTVKPAATVASKKSDPKPDTLAQLSAPSAPSHATNQVTTPRATEPAQPAIKAAPLKVGPELYAPRFADTVSLRQHAGQRPSAPEKLLFDIVWGGWSFRWVHAGQATLELLPTAAPQIVQMRSLAWGNGFFQSFYPVRDTVISWIHTGGIYPLSFTKILNEGSYRFRGHSIYDQARNRITLPDTSFSIAPFTHDVLSAFYFIRSQPLKVGDSLHLAAVSGKKAYNLKVICHRRETIEVPAGKFPCLVVEPILKGDGLFKAKGTLLIWMTDDSRHMPVKMQSKIPVGSIKAELKQKL